MTPGWAEKAVRKHYHYIDVGCGCVECVAPVYAQLLKQEHRRALKVVKKAEREQFIPKEWAVTSDWKAGYEWACKHIEDALQKGRT